MGRHDRVADLARLTELPRTGQGGSRPLEVADLGSGRGRTVRAVLALAPTARVHAVDVASTLDDDVLHDERVRSVIADLDGQLPFADAALDRIVSLNVLEHLADPSAHLRDCARVLRPGGVMVVAHSDWDTCLFAASDDQTTRSLVDAFTAMVPEWANRSDGFMGRKLLGLAAASPMQLVDVDTWADCHRRFDEDSVAWKVALGMVASVRNDPQRAGPAGAWLRGLADLSAAGAFLFTVTDVAVVLQVPPDRPAT